MTGLDVDVDELDDDEIEEAKEIVSPTEGESA